MNLSAAATETLLKMAATKTEKKEANAFYLASEDVRLELCRYRMVMRWDDLGGYLLTSQAMQFALDMKEQ